MVDDQKTPPAQCQVTRIECAEVDRVNCLMTEVTLGRVTQTTSAKLRNGQDLTLEEAEEVSLALALDPTFWSRLRISSARGATADHPPSQAFQISPAPGRSVHPSC